MALDERMKRVVSDLEPTVERELDRHLDTTVTWSPHEWIDWDGARNFARMGGEDWDPHQSRLRPVAQKALILNLLTEDNLPWYTHEIATVFGRDGAWGEWVGQWTAEENRHATAMRDFLITSRSASPDILEEGRMPHMKAGYSSGGKNPLEVTAYVTMQELATAVSHGNTGKIIGEDGYNDGEELLKRIATDERYHYLFYLNMGTAAFEREPDLMMQVVMNEAATFSMPGAGTIPNFKEDAREIAQAGIYSVPIHVKRVVEPVFKHWNVLTMTGLGPEGQQAQELIGQGLEIAQARAAKLQARYDELNEAQKDREQV